VDLDFRDGAGWRLIIELKIDSGLSEGQLERYAEEAPVALVSRDPGRFEIPTRISSWVGAVSWSEIVGSLRDLPIADRGPCDDCRSLLDVIEEDGGLSENKELGQEVIQVRDVLSGAAPGNLDGLQEVLRRTYGGSAENLCGELSTSGGSRWPLRLGGPRSQGQERMVDTDPTARCLARRVKLVECARLRDVDKNTADKWFHARESDRWPGGRSVALDVGTRCRRSYGWRCAAAKSSNQGRLMRTGSKVKSA
jgi:hypothetical protein